MSRSRFARLFAACVLVVSSSHLALAQELPLSGVVGYDFVWATAPSGSPSRMFVTNVHRSLAPIPIGGIVNSVPSRWAHRRRTLGALETAITSPARALYLTPMGDAVGNGGIQMVDLRAGTQLAFAPVGNPPGYDLAVVKPLEFVFSASDDGAGNTLLRGFSYHTPGVLAPLSPPTISIPGTPSAYVNRIGVDSVALQLHVPTRNGVQVIQLAASAPNMTAGSFHSTLPASPATNPASFERSGQTTWVIGTSTFNAATPPAPLAAGWLVWTPTGAVGAAVYGQVPTVPSKMWVPAAGTEELAVVGNGTDTYVYFLLREPGPGTFFIKPSAVGVTRFIGGNAPVTSTILMTDRVGEPFANPGVFGTRVALESSFGPPFTNDPPGGGEAISIIYTPLDPLGAGSLDGVLGVPAPLGGRISTKGVDRPIWTPDGTRVMAATSHFPGAPNPGIPGLEVLNVPADAVLDQFSAPHTVVPNLPFPNQSIIFPSVFRPRAREQAAVFGGMTFFGNVFNQGVASLGAASFGEIGQLQLDPVGFTQSIAIPDFRAIFPPSFDDATSATVPIPLSFGARRTTFNTAPNFGFGGLTMSAAMEDEILVQRTGTNFLAQLGVGMATDIVHMPLPANWITTTEFHSY